MSTTDDSYLVTKDKTADIPLRESGGIFWIITK